MISFELCANGVPVTKFSARRKPGPDGSFDYDAETGAVYEWESWKPTFTATLEQHTVSQVAHDPKAGIEALAHAILTDWLRLRDPVTKVSR